MTYQPKNYSAHGGENWVVGGTLTIASGGLLIDTDGKYEDLRFPSASARVPGSGGPGTSAVIGNLHTLAFDADSREVVYFQAQMPHSWKKSTTIKPHIHYRPERQLLGGNHSRSHGRGEHAAQTGLVRRHRHEQLHRAEHDALDSPEPQQHGGHRHAHGRRTFT